MMSLVAFVALASLASPVQGGDTRCKSPSLFQTRVSESRDTGKSGNDVFTKLFPSHSGIDLDVESSLAVSTVLQGNSTLNKSRVWKMINPSLYLTAAGSFRVLGRVTRSVRCACPAERKRWCYPEGGDGDDNLVSCPVGTGDRCVVIGPFTDPHAFQYSGHRLAFVNRGAWGVCKPLLLNLTSFEVRGLTLGGMDSCEKNWLPFEHAGILYFSHWVHPTHKVIRCDVESHVCETAFESSTKLSLDGLPSFLKSEGVEGLSVHGSSAYAELDSNHSVAAAHLAVPGARPGNLRYWHTFLAIQREPPFAVVANTPWFQMPVPDDARDAEWNEIQYLGGLLRDGEHFVLSYGVGDCFSQAVKVPVSEVAHALGI